MTLSKVVLKTSDKNLIPPTDTSSYEFVSLPRISPTGPGHRRIFRNLTIVNSDNDDDDDDDNDDDRYEYLYIYEKFHHCKFQ